MPDFEKDYPKIYDNLVTRLFDFVSDEDFNEFGISRILTFLEGGQTWTEYDHYLAYETFFGSLRDDNEFNYVLKLPRDQMINDLKINVPDTWEVYLKIIDYYMKN